MNNCTEENGVKRQTKTLQRRYNTKGYGGMLIQQELINTLPKQPGLLFKI
jgi:hypothetical protein